MNETIFSGRRVGLLLVLGPFPRSAPVLRLLQGDQGLQDVERVSILHLRVPILPIGHSQSRFIQPGKEKFDF